MPSSCCAVNCTNRWASNSNLKFYRIPRGPKSDPNRRSQWISAISRKDWEPQEHNRLCGKHFITGRPSDVKTHPDYIPTIFQHNATSTQTPQTKEKRSRRAEKRKRAKQEKERAGKRIRKEEEENKSHAVDALLELYANDANSIKDEDTLPDTDPAKEELDRLQTENKLLYDELGRLQTVNDTLKNNLEDTVFGVEYLKRKPNANEQISFCTGIPSVEMFNWVVDNVCDMVNPVHGISIPNQVLLVLMKLRLNNKNQELAMKFYIDRKRVSQILNNVIPCLALTLKMLINWPSREACVEHLPLVFRCTYPRCRVIIDCTEVFIQRPSNLTARAQTWSNYRHHNTFKFLIGITPTGAVSFVSKCWGGRVSDKELTQESAFLGMLEPTDQVLADRGFLIEEDIANSSAELIIPAFTRGEEQSSQRDVEFTSRIAHIRMHVETAIGRIKKFTILKDIFPITLIKHANDIVTICAALTNLLPKLDCMNIYTCTIY